MKTAAKRIYLAGRIFILLMIIQAACGPASSPEAATEEALSVSPTESEVPASEIEETGPVSTQISIDGDPSDWEGYEVLFSDPEGDYEEGGFDIAAVRAFTNDSYLYILIETYFPASDFVQLDLDMRSAARMFVISFWESASQKPFMGEVTTGQWVEVGVVESSASAFGEAIELKMPLYYFEDVADLQLQNIRPMTGECCEADWINIDDIQPMMVAQSDEVEPLGGGEQAAQVCAYQMPAPAPFGSLTLAPFELAEPGYTAEWFVAPGAFNMPMEIFITPDGDVLVQAIRSGTLSRLDTDGSVTPISEDVHAYYQGDVDDEGNVYLLQSPSVPASIARISPEGSLSVIAQSRDMSSVCICPLEIGPDDDLYAAISDCAEESTLLKVSSSGRVMRLVENFADAVALHTAPDGRLLAATSQGEVFAIDLDDYSQTSLGEISGGNISPSGLTADAEGNIYVSTGSRSPLGELYRLDSDGEVTKLADIPNNGLSGIEWSPETGEIIGAQLVWGGVIAVKPDGSQRELVAGNGIITPFGIAFSPCGDLVSANDDGGMMGIIDPTGKPEWLFDFVSFIPPVPFMAFAPDGSLYASEGAPSFPERVVVAEPGRGPQPFIEAAFPSGLAVRADGTVFVSDTSAGRIRRINPDGSELVVADGLSFPQALALDLENNLYAVIGPSDFTPDPAVFPAPTYGDRIVRITPEGEITTVFQGRSITAIAIGPSGQLFATAGGNHTDGEIGEVLSISEDGSASVVASGFAQPTGLAFDLAGYLYVADEVLSGIARIAGFPQGELSGTVVDETGSPVAEARVQVISVDPIVVGQVVFSDTDGRFSVPVAPRTYRISVSAEGYEEASIEGIAVAAEQTEEIVIELEKY